MKSLIHQWFSLLRRSWWLEILTASPSCGYFFGPFSSEREAVEEQLRYVKHIKQKGSEVLIVSVVRRQRPAELTIEYSEAA